MDFKWCRFYWWQRWKSRRWRIVFGCYLYYIIFFWLNGVNMKFTPRLDPNVTGWEREREREFKKKKKAFSEWQMKNVSNSYQSPHLEWWSLGGRVFWITLGRIDDVTSTVGWWDGQKHGFLWRWYSISVFHFQAPHFALDEAHHCCFLNPAVACTLNLIWQGWDMGLRCIFSFPKSLMGRRWCIFLYSVSTM